jgi:hypothetical protein
MGGEPCTSIASYFCLVFLPGIRHCERENSADGSCSLCLYPTHPMWTLHAGMGGMPDMGGGMPGMGGRKYSYLLICQSILHREENAMSANSTHLKIS